MISCQTELYLWELMEHRSLWWKLFPPRDIQLPKSGHREMTVEAAFHASPVSQPSLFVHSLLCVSIYFLLMKMTLYIHASLCDTACSSIAGTWRVLYLCVRVH